MVDRRQLIFGGAAMLSGCAMPAIRSSAAPVDLIGDVQRRTFAFFWDRANPANGLMPDRWPSPSFSSIAATGFALTAYPIGV